MREHASKIACICMAIKSAYRLTHSAGILETNHLHKFFYSTKSFVNHSWSCTVVLNKFSAVDGYIAKHLAANCGTLYIYVYVCVYIHQHI